MALALALVILSISAFMALGRWYLTKGKARSVDRLRHSVDLEIEQRLRSILEVQGGSIVEGPALETPAGRLSLFPSKAPESFVIDAARFASSMPGEAQATVVRIEDSNKVMSKGLKRFAPPDPEDAKTYVVFAADEESGRCLGEGSFLEKMRALDRAVRGRCRLQVVRGSATVLLARGLSTPEEIKAFYGGCVDLVAALKARLGGNKGRGPGSS